MTLKAENFPEQKRPLVNAILKIGNANRFAKLIGVHRQAIDGWLYNCKLAPPVRYCKQIEDAMQGELTRAQLRPDIFGDIDQKELSDTEKLENCIFVLKGIAEKIADTKKRSK